MLNLRHIRIHQSKMINTLPSLVLLDTYNFLQCNFRLSDRRNVHALRKSSITLIQMWLFWLRFSLTRSYVTHVDLLVTVMRLLAAKLTATYKGFGDELFVMLKMNKPDKTQSNSPSTVINKNFTLSDSALCFIVSYMSFTEYRAAGARVKRRA